MATSKNDVTGDLIASRTSNKQYDSNYDTIFPQKTEVLVNSQGKEFPKCGKRCWAEVVADEFKCNKPNCTGL